MHTKSISTRSGQIHFSTSSSGLTMAPLILARLLFRLLIFTDLRQGISLFFVGGDRIRVFPMSVASTPLKWKLSTKTFVFRNLHNRRVLTFDFVCVARLRFDNKHAQRCFLQPRSDSNGRASTSWTFSLQQQEKNIRWKTSVGWNIKHEIMEKTMTPNWFLASLFTFLSTLASIHNITSDLDDLPFRNRPQDFLLGPKVGKPPNLCLGPLTLQRRVSDGQIFQQAFFFRLLKKLSVLPHSSSNIALGPSALFQKTLSPQPFTWKTEILHMSVTATQPNTNALGNWFSWHLWRSSKISSWHLPSSCPWPFSSKTLQ